MTFKITDSRELHSLEAFIWSESEFAYFQYFSEVLSARTWTIPWTIWHTQSCVTWVSWRPGCQGQLWQRRKDQIAFGLGCSQLPPRTWYLRVILHPASNVATVLFISGCIPGNRRGRGKSCIQPLSKIWKVSCRLNLEGTAISKFLWTWTQLTLNKCVTSQLFSRHLLKWKSSWEDLFCLLN